jgi:hypothetical protein
MRALGAVVVLVLAVMFTAPTRAQEAANVPAMHEELAKSLFAEGVKLSEEGRWGDAAERFSRSFQLFPRSRTALNLSVALMRAGRPVQALEALDHYSGLASDVPAEELERATKLREQIESMTAHLSLEVFPVETELEIDRRPLPHLAKQWLVLDPGRHDVEARYRGERRTLTLELKAGERVTHEIRWPHVEPALSPAAAASSLPIESSAPTRAEPPPRRWKRWVWIGSAVVVAAGAAAITTWAVRRDSGSSSCPDEQICIH